eukprot:2607081-Prymnesium_polylepis.1
MTEVAAALARPFWAKRADDFQLVRAAFAAGCASFSRGGYRFGDPVDFFHPPGHAHWARPDFQGCRHCAPPVQGKVVLLYAKRDSSGDVEEVFGRDVIRSDERSWKRRWRGLNTGMRLVERTGWNRTNEAVRDLHRAQCAAVAAAGSPNGGPGTLLAVRRQRSADPATHSAPLLWPELGSAS